MHQRDRWVLLGLLSLTACQTPTDEAAPALASTDAEPAADSRAELGRRVVEVAAPTGLPAVDRANINAAIADARPGDIVQFQAGTYYIDRVPGGLFVVSVPGVTLSGHPPSAGRPTTAIRGGPIRFDEFDPVGFFLSGSRQTVRNIEFIAFRIAIVFEGFEGEQGGHRVQGCRFTRTLQGVGGILASTSRGVEILDNEFVNVGFPAVMSVSNSRFAGNVVRAPEPAAVPVLAQPGNVAELGCVVGTCSNNVFEDNFAVGISDGFFIGAFESTVARGNVVRRNRLVGQRVFTEADRGSMVNIVSLGGAVRDNLVMGNVFRGSEGVGVVLEGARHNTIANNLISGISGSSPLLPDRLRGVGIFLDQGSNRNELLVNRFSDNVGPDIKLFGNQNLVVTRGKTTVLDFGRGNQIQDETAAAGMARRAPHAPTPNNSPTAYPDRQPKSWPFFAPLLSGTRSPTSSKK
jgi:parallel beta-helix repeat protein